jgi:hypothetical protein
MCKYYNYVLCVHLLHIFFFGHNKWTRPILYVVIYFFCNVFLTIHTLVYVITFVLCHHLYLDVCVCPLVMGIGNIFKIDDRYINIDR